MISPANHQQQSNGNSKKTKNSAIFSGRTPSTAARAYNEAALKYHGEFVSLDLSILTKPSQSPIPLRFFAAITYNDGG
jgi:hypothetical protein